MNFKKSDKVWEWLDKQKVGFSKKKIENESALADESVSKYRTDFNRLMKLVEDKTGKRDPMKVRPNDVYEVVKDLVVEYQDGKKANASFLRGIDDALHAFKESSKASGTFSRELRLGDKRVISGMLNEGKVYRRARDTTVQVGTREDTEKVIAEIEKMRITPQAKQTAISCLRLELETGRRIGAILSTKVDNYDAVKGQFVSYGDKGGKDNISYFLTPTAKLILDKHSLNEKGKEKSGGDMMFKIKYTQHKDPKLKGQDKSVKAMYKQVSNYIKIAAQRAGVNREEEGQKFSSHATRKGFANERADHYIEHMTAAERRAELDRRRAADPDLDKRVASVLDNIKKKFKIDENAKSREFTDIEVVKLLVSMDIDHSRIDVMRYYLLDYDFSALKKKK